MEMITKLYQIFGELNFTVRQPFDFQYNETNIHVQPFASDDNQVFLIIEMDDLFFRKLQISDFNIPVARAFREQKDFYTPDMDKNASLLFCINNMHVEPFLTQIQVEDDPFYFKKYVICYTKEEADALNSELVNGKTFQTLFHEVLGNITIFRQFKENPKNFPLYSCAVKLMSKIPVLKIPQISTAQLVTIDDFFSEEPEQELLNRCALLVQLEQQLEHDIREEQGEDWADAVISIWEKIV